MEVCWSSDQDRRACKRSYMKYTIGSVTFSKVGQSWKNAPCGDQRIALLRKFYRGEDLGEYTAIVLDPRRQIKWCQVNWDTAGKRVTD